MHFSRTILVLVFLLCFVRNGFAEETIILTNGEWPPYMSEHLKHHGVVSRIVSEAFALEGVKVEYAFFPWKRAFALAKTGKFDGSVVWWKTPEREKDFYFSDPVLDVQYVFFHLRSNRFDWKTTADLKGVEIGATQGYNYGESFQNAEKNGEIIVQRVPMDELNFKKLLKRKIDIFPVDVEVGYTMLKNIFPPEEVGLFTHHPTPVRSDPHHLILSKKNEKNRELVVLFNKGLKRLKESERIFQYLAESRRGDYRRENDQK